MHAFSCTIIRPWVTLESNPHLAKSFGTASHARNESRVVTGCTKSSLFLVFSTLLSTEIGTLQLRNHLLKHGPFQWLACAGGVSRLQRTAFVED
jgi:hypothetical protein